MLRRWSSWMRRPALRCRPSGSAATLGMERKLEKLWTRGERLAVVYWLAAWAGVCARAGVRMRSVVAMQRAVRCMETL